MVIRCNISQAVEDREREKGNLFIEVETICIGKSHGIGKEKDENLA